LTGKVFLETDPRANATSRRTHSRGIAPIDATGYRKGFNYCPKVAEEGQEGVALVTFDFAKLQPVITELQLQTLPLL